MEIISCKRYICLQTPHMCEHVRHILLYGAFEGGTLSTNVDSCPFPDSSPDGDYKLTNAHWTHVRHNNRHVEVLADAVLPQM